MQLYIIIMHIVHINCNLNLLSLYSIPCSKIQGSAVEAFIQLTVFSYNLCHDKDKIKWEPIAGYQYTVRVKVI